MDKRILLLGVCIMMMSQLGTHVTGTGITTNTTGFIHYYPFDSDAIDYYGISNLTEYNITYVTGNFSGAASMNGSVSTSRMQSINGNLMKLNTSGTISFFDKQLACVNDSGNGKSNVLIYMGNGVGTLTNFNGVGLWIAQLNNHIEIIMSNSTDSSAAHLSSNDSDCANLNDTWVYHTYTYTYTKETSQMVINYYRNGVLYGSNTTTISNMKDGTITGTRFRIGRDAVTTYYHTGIIDELLLANKVMTSVEILNMYNNYANGYRPIDVVPPADTCSCPTGANWFINMPDHCNITSPCNNAGYNITFTNGTSSDYCNISTAVNFSNINMNSTGTIWVWGANAILMRTT